MCIVDGRQSVRTDLESVPQPSNQTWQRFQSVGWDLHGLSRVFVGKIILWVRVFPESDISLKVDGKFKGSPLPSSTSPSLAPLKVRGGQHE